MAEVTGGPDAGSTGVGEHAAGHEGIGVECPISCLGVQTVGDLLGLLVEAGRSAGLFAAVAVEAVAAAPHEHAADRLTRACPIGCLELPERVRNVLRRNVRDFPAKTVGDLLDLLWSRELYEVRQMGPRRVGEVQLALLAAGFSVPSRL